MRIRRFRSRRKWSLKRFFKSLSFKALSFWLLAASLLVVIGPTIYAIYFLPSVQEADQLSFAQSTIIYDRQALDPENDPNEHILYVIHGDENREYIPLEEISPWLRKATLAIEDDRFYNHFGFDIGGILKGVLGELGFGKRRGGSTITQQLVKNAFLSRARTYSRKLNELLLSIKVEWNYTKDEILELYLNKIPYGNNAHGAEAAAKTFFGKSARDLTIAESAVLASLPVAPTRFSPYGSNLDLLMGYPDTENPNCPVGWCKGRKDLVLQRMHELKMITFEEFKQAVNESKEIEFKRYKTDIKAPHFVFYVRERMEEKYGKEFLKQGGLRIYTTLDRELQDAAEEVIASKSAHYRTTYGANNMALTAINPETGEILSYVGGKDFFDEENDGQVDVLTSRRQPGSSFKPLVYATAFEKGYTPATVVFDVETDFGGNYKPQNFNGEFQGPVSLRQSLNESLNIPAVKTAYLAGPHNILENAEKLGIQYEGSGDAHGVALGVGVAEVEPLSHINSFSTFVNEGPYYNPLSILEVHDAKGNVLEKADFEKHKKEGLDPEIAGLVRNILTDESTRPTTDDFDWNVLLQLEGFNNGSKTGTSNRKAENPEFNEEEPEDEEDNPKLITVPGDSWTIGFTPHLVAGVWVGNNRGEPMKPGATGLSVAAPVWKRFMDKAHDSLIERGADKNKLYVETKPLEVRKVNKFSGKLASDTTPPELAVEEVFASHSLPTDIDDSVQQIEIDKISGRPANEFTPQYAKTLKYALNLGSIRPDMPHWQNPVEDWIKEHPRFMTSLGTIMDTEDEDLEEGITRWDTRLLGSDRRLLRDDIHNAYNKANAPVIKIASLRNGSSLAPGRVEIKTSTSARFGMRGVEFYFDDQLVDDTKLPPYTGRFDIPANTPLGSSHTIRVVAIDRLLNTSSDEIEVTIDRDKEGPEIQFLGPVGNQKIPLGSLIQVSANVYDSGSAIREVLFFLDDSPLTPQAENPLATSFIASGKLGRRYLKIIATDIHGNKNEKSIPVSFERERLVTQDKPMVTKVIKYRTSASVDITFPSPEQIEFAELVISKGGETQFYHKFETIQKFAQLQIPRSYQGRGNIQLISKLRGSDEPYLSPQKELSW